MARERRRVSKEDVRNNAKQGGGGQNWMTLPEGVRNWVPEKPTTYEIDVVPYEVKMDNHPDKTPEKGMLWYKFPFQVHHGVGAGDESIVCPGTIGKPCPICKKRAKLAKDDYEANKEAIGDLNAQRYVAFNILDPDDKDKIAIFAMSTGKFWDFKGGGLKKELEEGDDSILNFFDVNKDGRTLKVRFGEETWMKNTFLRANRFDFVPRGELDEDEILGKVVCLDEVWDGILPYDKITAMFEEGETAGGGESGKESASEGRPRTRSGSSDGKTSTDEPKSGASAKKGDKDDSVDDSVDKSVDKDKDEDKPTWCVGDKVQFKSGSKTIVGKIIDIDDEDVVVEDAEGDDHDADLDDLKPVKEEKAAKGAEKKADKAPAKAAEKDDEDKDEKAPSGKIEVGARVVDEEGQEGVVTKIKGDDVSYKDDKGNTHVEDIEDLKIVSDKKADKAPAKTETKPKAKEFEEGDDVTWGNGKEGELLKLHSSGKKWKVREADGEELFVSVDELALAD